MNWQKKASKNNSQYDAQNFRIFQRCTTDFSVFSFRNEYGAMRTPIVLYHSLSSYVSVLSLFKYLAPPSEKLRAILIT